MRSRTFMVGTFVLAAAAVVGCSSSGASSPPAAPSVAPSVAASVAPSAAAAGNTVEAKPVGAIGTVIVAGSNGMTVYTFAKDTKDATTSACLDACAVKWPPLTVPAGGTPTAGAGATGKLATITRPDGTLQVTYNGLPLYFFQNDKAPGDALGVYTNWLAVKP